MNELPAGPCAGKAEFDSCSDGGKTGKCVGGSCCTGCYYYDTGTPKCQVTPDKAKCGKDGGSCSTCKAFEFCDSAVGSCDTDPGANFKLIAKRAGIIDDPTKTWDTVGSAPPDPYLGLVWGTTSCSVLSLSKCTGSVSNDFTPDWSFDMGTFAASKLLGKHCIYVIDSDGPFACAPPFETIGECQIDFDKLSFRYGYEYVWSCPNVADAKNYVSFVRFELVHVP